MPRGAKTFPRGAENRNVITRSESGTLSASTYRVYDGGTNYKARLAQLMDLREVHETSVHSEHRDVAQSRIAELDGFRAIAVWMVILDHLIDGWPLPLESVAWIPRPLFVVVTHGWLGVDLFFVLSGFLITGILLDGRDTPNYFRKFYGRRALRILPLAVSCIAVWFVAYGSEYWRFFALALLFSANLSGLFGAPQPHGPSVLWSLAVEEHFYLLWPIAVRFLRRRLLAIFAIAVVLGSPILRYWGVSHGLRADGEVYSLSWFRFDGLALGALLAIWMRSRVCSPRATRIAATTWLAFILAVTLLLLPFGVLSAHTPASAALRFSQAQAVFVAAMALALTYPRTVLTAPLRSRFAMISANFSYCLYLVHLPIGDLYYWILQRLAINDVFTFGAQGALLARSIVVLAASFVVAAFSRRYLEAPFMRLRGRFT